MLDIRNLDASIGATSILRDINIHIASQRMVGLIGRNGAGKTTLLRTIMGHVTGSGTIEFEGIDLITTEAYHRAELGIGYMPEDRKLVPEFSVTQNILLPTWTVEMSDADARLAWIYELMPEIAKFSERKALELSGGQQKLVALGRALMAGRKLLALDEPFEGLAPALARRLSEVMVDLKSEGVSMLISDSSEHHVGDLLDEKYIIERGSILE